MELLELLGMRRMPILKAKGEAEGLCAQLNGEGQEFLQSSFSRCELALIYPTPASTSTATSAFSSYPIITFHILLPSIGVFNTLDGPHCGSTLTTNHHGFAAAFVPASYCEHDGDGGGNDDGGVELGHGHLEFVGMQSLDEY
ncbi:hypothetical protein RHGRI_004814 [Rhododendron griersonianum]|uniref:Uncharacterized protein n=1 Tax=Rhododendron griersonianum TaxID=479676 RepID=A0AAV6LA06_9ERIC|nr:hypothetical protein RHGRI_004814 [Rhododendron griersonianum]